MNEAALKPLAIAVSVIAGAFMAVQARVNGGLGVELQNGMLAALISFGSGLLIVTAILLFSPKAQSNLSTLRAAVTSGRLPWWNLFAGAIGGFFVITQGVVAGVIGIALFSVGVVFGQAVSALVIDGNGLLGMTKRPIGMARIVGTQVALFGLVLASDLTNYAFSPLVLLPLFAGAGIGFQQAMNGRLGKAAKSPTLATFLNFLTGTAFIAIAMLVVQGGITLPETLPGNPLLYIGGIVGVVFIYVQVVVVPKIGALAMGISLLVGQLSGSLALDHLIPVAQRELTLVSILGLLLVLAGATVVALRR